MKNTKGFRVIAKHLYLISGYYFTHFIMRAPQVVVWVCDEVNVTNDPRLNSHNERNEAVYFH